MSLFYKFPKIYDFVLEKFFHFEADSEVQNILEETIQIGKLESNSLILDVACGTGITTLWLAEQRPDIQIIGIDSSKQMIAQAKYEADNKKLNNVFFIHKAADEFNMQDVTQVIPDNKKFDMIVCAHGFSAMRNYENVFKHTMSLLVTGGNYIIMDLHYPTKNFLTMLVGYSIDKFLLGSNQFSKHWLPMQKELANFTKYEKPVKDFGIVKGIYYIAKGTKQ